MVLSEIEVRNAFMIAICLLKQRGINGLITNNGNFVSLKDFQDTIQNEIDELIK